MTRTSGEAVRSGRMISRCVSAPSAADDGDADERGGQERPAAG